MPHLTEAFLLDPTEYGTELTWHGELGTDGWAIGASWGDRVALAWTRAVGTSLRDIRTEAERRAHSRHRADTKFPASMTSDDRLFPVVEGCAVPWLSVEQMREVDRIMIEELGISLIRMMENAGRGLAHVARALIGVWRGDLTRACQRVRSCSRLVRPACWRWRQRTAAEAYAEVRRAAFGEDVGHNG